SRGERARAGPGAPRRVEHPAPAGAGRIRRQARPGRRTALVRRVGSSARPRRRLPGGQPSLGGGAAPRELTQGSGGRLRERSPRACAAGRAGWRFGRAPGSASPPPLLRRRGQARAGVRAAWGPVSLEPTSVGARASRAFGARSVGSNALVFGPVA